MTSATHTCHRCGATLARRQNGLLVFAAKVLLITAGKARVECGCGKLVWVRIGAKETVAA